MDRTPNNQFIFPKCSILILWVMLCNISIICLPSLTCNFPPQVWKPKVSYYHSSHTTTCQGNVKGHMSVLTTCHFCYCTYYRDKQDLDIGWSAWCCLCINLFGVAEDASYDIVFEYSKSCRDREKSVTHTHYINILGSLWFLVRLSFWYHLSLLGTLFLGLPPI